MSLTCLVALILCHHRYDLPEVTVFAHNVEVHALVRPHLGLRLNNRLDVCHAWVVVSSSWLTLID